MFGFVKQEILAYAGSRNFLTAILLRRVVPTTFEKALDTELLSSHFFLFLKDLDSSGSSDVLL